MNEWVRVILGPAITLAIALVCVVMWVGALANDVKALKKSADRSEIDHDVVIRLGSDIDNIRNSLARIEQAVGIRRKEAAK